MIVLFTDFGSKGPYIGQMTAKLRMCGYADDVINLFSDAPAFSVKASACLLRAYSADFPPGSLFLSIIDPGVGSTRKPIVVRSKQRWFTGPDNGLFELILRQDAGSETWEITWAPEILSASFHGRDVFAPVAASLLKNGIDSKFCQLSTGALNRFDWPDDIPEVVYIDHYGNAVTGLRAGRGITTVTIGRRILKLSQTFSNVECGEPLAYENSSGLIEIAVNKRRADQYFDLSVGSFLGYQMG